MLSKEEKEAEDFYRANQRAVDEAAAEASIRARAAFNLFGADSPEAAEAERLSCIACSKQVYLDDPEPAPIAPKVGMGATIMMFSDRRAATIVFVSPSGKTIVVQRDEAKRIDKNGFSEIQKYEFTPNPKACKETYTLRKNGRWIAVGAGLYSSGFSIQLGERREYYDYTR